MSDPKQRDITRMPCPRCGKTEIRVKARGGWIMLCFKCRACGMEMPREFHGMPGSVSTVEADP